MRRGRINSHVHECLERLYVRFNDAEYIHPDPLEFVHRYSEAGDREVVGLISASLAFGNVKQILASVERVLGVMGAPRAYVMKSDSDRIREDFKAFRHRFASGADLGKLLSGARRVIEENGALGAGFRSMVREEDETIAPALCRFLALLRGRYGYDGNFLLPEPSLGSACKRFHLYVRWMVRRDNVDVGIWKGVPASKLVVPVDTHMHRIGRLMGLTMRKQADLRTALELTEAFRGCVPEDPVRYDFALTRLGIRDDTVLGDFIGECGFG